MRSRRTMTARGGGEQGFSLIEVVIAIGILAGVLLSICSMFILGGRQLKTGKTMTEATTIGAVANSGGRGFVTKGAVTGNGLYKGVAGNAIVIGGLGQVVNIAGGMTISGSVSAAASDRNGHATRWPAARPWGPSPGRRSGWPC